MNDNYMIVNGTRYPVINSWVEVESPSDGRRRWGIVTDPGTEVPTTGAEEHPAPQPAAPAEATADDACRKCGRTFIEDGKFLDSAAKDGNLPFCKTCVDRCHDTEIADHWCEIDQYRHEQKVKAKAMNQEAAEAAAREVWPEAEGFLPHTRGWTFRCGGGYAYVTAGGAVAREPQGTRNAAVTFMGRRTPPASTQ